MKAPHPAPSPTELPAGLAQPAQRALAAAGIQDLAQLSTYTRQEITRLHGIGPNALATLERSLAERRLSFRSVPFSGTR